MNYLESLRVAWRALRVNKMRSLLTALGIVVGVAAVVCMVSIGNGAQAQVSEKIRTLGANLLLVNAPLLRRIGDQHLAHLCAGQAQLGVVELHGAAANDPHQ